MSKIMELKIVKYEKKIDIKKLFLKENLYDNNKFNNLPPSNGYIGNRLKNNIL